ncbi:MAG: putative DNA binding domain-containing protein [Chloroflexi bacterium]|nr:putative DNA binding domain-containing protein [Chloroflexota bacterium]
MAAAGESERLEFKAGRAAARDIVDAAVCFANGDGGLVLWGIDDDGGVSGTTFRDPQALRKQVFHGTSPSQVVEAQGIEMNGLLVIALWVAHSPVLVSTSGGAYLQRLGTECVPMTPDRLVIRQIDTRALDLSAALTPVGVSGIDELEVQRYRQLLPTDDAGERLRRLGTIELLEAIGALSRMSGESVLTVAGLLVFGTEQELRSTLPQHHVVYLRTPTGSTEYERRVVSSAPVLRLIDQLLLEVSAAARTRTLRMGAQDLELPDYPERVLREAIVNAIAHRHYTLPGDIVVRQTTSRVEIENPGGFPEGIDADSVIQHAPVHRNRRLCDLLDRVRLMERSGLGVDRIFEDQLRFGKAPPTYDADRTSVRLRLDARDFDEPFARFVIGEEQRGRVWRVEELLVASHLRRMGPADRATLARVMQRTEREAQDILQEGLGQILDRFGSGPGSRFALSARVQAILGAEAAYTRERGLAREAQRNLILQHADQFGRVDNRTVRDLLQVQRSEATNLLRALEKRGLLIQRGSRRWAYYEPVPQSTLPM